MTPLPDKQLPSWFERLVESRRASYLTPCRDCGRWDELIITVCGYCGRPICHDCHAARHRGAAPDCRTTATTTDAPPS